MYKNKLILPITIILLILLLFSCKDSSETDYPQNIIIMIGDGMGFEQVKAAGMYLNGEAGTLIFESLPNTGEVLTYCANNPITDSAASATAMATGIKVNLGVISMSIPGNGEDLETILEFYKAEGKRTGLVTTTFITHATPAGFGAHEPSRENYNEIGLDYLTSSRPNVLFGGGENGISILDAQNAGYIVITTESELISLNPYSGITYISGQFGDTHLPYEYDNIVDDLPSLTDMVSVALEILKTNPNGFFLLIEGGRIDHAGHDNHIERNIFETIEFANAVSIVLDFYNDNPDTLVIITADHETGGLVVINNNGAGNFPDVTWSTDYHTSANVPVYAIGPNSELVHDTINNTDIYSIMKAKVELTH
jgi:alkaline phosphatase